MLIDKLEKQRLGKTSLPRRSPEDSEHTSAISVRTILREALAVLT